MASPPAEATVIITTKNRKDDLRKALASALMQDARIRVLVIDDGSTDDTSDMMRREFPMVQLDRVEQSLGLIVQRNRGAALAQTPLVVSIDDDAIFSAPGIVSRTIAEFQDSRVGAVAIPFVNVNYGQDVKQMAPDERGIFVTGSYMGTAHALRRELFLDLGGYREFLFHQGEEEDYCIRMLAAGYFVRLGRADPIHHFESPKRDFRRRDIFGRRNNVLFIWCNVPLVNLPMRLLGTTVNGIRLGIRVRRLRRMVYGLLIGYAAIFRYWRQRRAVSLRVYRAFRRLGQTAVQLSEAEKWLSREPPRS
ncbi:MAG: glycosyltransferase [Tepidisphaeraceae bacterium]|jgi:glycosyltransferase involved in cell wall biosynthesis